MERRNSLKELVKKNNGGKDLRTILAEAVQANGTVQAAAKDIGVDVKTFTRWADAEGLAIQRQTVAA